MIFDSVYFKLLATPIEDLGRDIDDYEWGDLGYDAVLNSFNIPILLRVDDDDYQGDIRVVFQHGDYYGLLIYGFGSCSGCDMLKGCSSSQELEAVRHQMFIMVKWDTAANLVKYIKEKDWELEYCYHSENTKHFIQASLDVLQKRA